MSPLDFVCPACGHTCSQGTPQDTERLDDAARYEAAQVVMRWKRGVPVGPACIHPDGTGRCDPPTPGMVTTEQYLLILFAGLAADALLLPVDLDTITGPTMDEARTCLTPDYLRTFFGEPTSQAEGLRHFYAHAYTILADASWHWECVAEELSAQSHLSGEALQALCAHLDATELEDTRHAT